MIFRYLAENLDKAIDAVKKGMSVRKAAQKYEVPRSTLHDRVHNGASAKVGRPTELNKEEEDIIVDRANLMTSWGFLLTSEDLKELVKGYLDAKGVESKIFKNNMPGYEFVRGFIKRHPRIVFRSANLIKRSRASVSREEMFGV